VHGCHAGRVQRVAVVTGAGSGIGAASAVALAADGWHVVLAGRRPDPLQALAAAHPETMTARPADVSDEDAVHALFTEVVDRFGRVDLLFNNAGRGAPPATPDETSVAEWRQIVEVNLTGVFLCTREAFGVMRRQSPQGGRIINNGSIAATAPRPGAIGYTATKHAVTGLTRATSLDGRPYRIACGQIDVGNAATDMTEPMAAGIAQPDGTVRVEPRMDVDDVARAVVYMASLPLEANVLTMTVMASAMPLVGRG